MSKIWPSESEVKYKKIRFKDFDSDNQEKDSFFALRFPIEPENEKKDSLIGVETSIKKIKPIAENRKDLEGIKKEAYTKGKVDGRLEAEEKLHTATQTLGTALRQISLLRKSILLKSKEDMLRLIMAVARRVIHTEIEEKKDVILQTLTKALQAAVQADKYYIRVNPKDLNMVTEKESFFLASMKRLTNIYFLADETISRGGCIAESQTREVDATIESQLNEIYECLRKEIL